MKFIETRFKGAFVIELEKKGDDRGFFARSFCRNELRDYGLEYEIVQINNSLTEKMHTLRGLHYQLPPRAEVKIVRCIRGSLFDVILDIREGSSTFGEWFGVELSAENRRMLYVPRGFAHGFMTLEDHTEAFYLVTEFYSPELERGIRWNDLRFGITWPVKPKIISEKDQSHKDFNPDYHLK